MFTSPRRLFAKLTSELTSHLAVHQDQVARRGIDFQYAETGARYEYMNLLAGGPRA